MAAEAVHDHDPEALESSQRIAGHLRRIAFNHRTAAAYQNDATLDPEQMA